MPSSEWDRFMENFFGDPYMMWHDGIDPTSVLDLKGDEREKAEEMLIESMKEGSYWAPMGLAELKSKKALPELKDLLTKSSGKMRIEISVALCTIEETHEYVPVIIDVLKQNPSEYIRLDAARALRYYPTHSVVDALFDAVLDPAYLVRNHACESLLHIHGLQAIISNHREIFKHIIFDYPEEEGADTWEAYGHYRQAVELLRELISEEGTPIP